MWLQQVIERCRSEPGCPDDVPSLVKTVLPADGQGPSHDAIDMLRPVVRDCLSRFGHEGTLAALVSLVVAEAVAWKRPAPMAQVLLHNAQMLEATALRWERSAALEGRGLRKRSEV